MNRVREERLKRGWSQTVLSSKTLIAQSDLSLIENGRRFVCAGWRVKLAKAFKVPVETLFGNDDADGENAA
jgi:transcriptional regulator with XRE-family HTH domain